jgi:DUF1680 family protein
MGTKEGVSINFYVDGSYELLTPKGQKLTVIQKTDYPVTGLVQLSFKLEREEEITLRLRIPGWSKVNKVKMNGMEIGEIVGDIPGGGFHRISKILDSRDVIQLEFDMRGKVELLQDQSGRFAAIKRGPVVLARDSSLEGPSLSTIKMPVTDNDGNIELKKVEEAGEYWMVYEAKFLPESYTEEGAKPVSIQLVDYASAGNGKEQSVFKVWSEMLWSGRK